MNIPSSIVTMLAGILLTLVSVWYGQNHGLMPVAASEEAPLVDGLFNAMMTVSTGLFLIVQCVILIAAFKFRQRKGDDTDAAPVHGNIPLEILWTAIPAVIVLAISVYSFDIYAQMGGMDPMSHAVSHAQPTSKPGAAIAAPLPTDTTTGAPETRNQEVLDAVTQDPASAAARNETLPQKKDSPVMGVTSPRIGPTPDKQGQPAELAVNVTGLQYAWIFTYPDTGIATGELHLPAGREVKLNISANDVIHAFWVPEFRLKQDAIPGRQTELVFTPKIVGEYPVICAELCGAYHGAMKTKVIIHTPEDYQSWMQSQVASNPVDHTVIANNAATPESRLSAHLQDFNVPAAALHQLASSPHTHVHDVEFSS